MLRMITNRGPSPKLKPLPRAAQTNRSPSPAPLRGFPLPLWRGVNGIANHSRTGSPCPVLQHPTLCLLAPNVMSSYIQRLFSFCVNIILIRVGCWRMGHGGHHPTLICIPNNEANHSRTGSPCPVLQQEARVFTPLSNGEGLGVGLLYIYAILRAFSETHQITV